MGNPMAAPTCPECGTTLTHWRDRLPERRGSVSWNFDHDFGSAVVSFRATASWFPSGALGEVFVNGAKLSSATDIMICDAAIAASLAVQYGCPPEELAKALKRHPDGRPMGPLGAVLDEILKMEAGA